MATFRTTEGVEVPIAPVSMRLSQMIYQKVVAELEGQGLNLAPPTYTITTAVGIEEIYPLDAESAQTHEQLEALKAYEAAVARRNAEFMKRSTAEVFKRGILIGAPPKEWVAEMKAEGFDLPTEPAALRHEYIEIEYLKTIADIRGCIEAVLELTASGAPKEDREAVKATFRDPVGK